MTIRLYCLPHTLAENIHQNPQSNVKSTTINCLTNARLKRQFFGKSGIPDPGVMTKNFIFLNWISKDFILIISAFTHWVQSAIMVMFELRSMLPCGGNSVARLNFNFSLKQGGHHPRLDCTIQALQYLILKISYGHLQILGGSKIVLSQTHNQF